MKRYLLCDVIGDGSDEDQWRAAVQDYGYPCTVELPIDGNTGQPTSAWCLAIVSAPTYIAIRADARIDLLPDYPLDGKISGIDNSVKTAMLSAFSRRGIDTAIVNTTDGYRDLIRALGGMLRAGFDEDGFNVAVSATEA